jgi:putative transposase
LLRSFRSFREAQRDIDRWIGWYNEGRPHQALGYLSPRQYRAQQLNMVA